jgi:outer membrane protein OmpA-like peptidoglycan-associated protein
MKKHIALALIAFTFACRKHENMPAPAPTATAPAAGSPAATASTATNGVYVPTANADNLLSLAAGAFPVVRASAPEQGASAYYMFDDDPTIGWVSGDDATKGSTVVEMADRALIKRVEFDEEHIDHDGRLPKKVRVEVSDASAIDGFKPIGEFALTEMKNLAFPVAAEVPGRWVRLTVGEAASEHAPSQIMEFRAFGDRLTHDPMPNISGTYETNAGQFHLKQEGATVTGCYEHASEPLNGGMEGRVLKFKYAIGDQGSGPALLVVSGDGQMFGGWWRTDGAAEHPKLDPIEGKRTSTDPGKTACPQWNKPPDQQLADDLKKTGRLRLYGINFDSDSDVIRGESKPTLDQVVAMLKANADWKITIEGHTDATSTPEHNQDLSARRANSVKQYLATAGIDAARLTASGLGSTKPVATNDNALGRAANRRVELVKQ